MFNLQLNLLSIKWLLCNVYFMLILWLLKPNKYTCFFYSLFPFAISSYNYSLLVDKYPTANPENTPEQKIIPNNITNLN